MQCSILNSVLTAIFRSTSFSQFFAGFSPPVQEENLGTGKWQSYYHPIQQRQRTDSSESLSLFLPSSTIKRLTETASLCLHRFSNIVRSFVIAGRGPANSGLQRWDLYVGPMRQPRERRGIGRCVRCMCELCRVEESISNGHSLWRMPSNPLTCKGLTPCSSCA